MKTSIVIGLGYGDEGKGLTTDYLCASQQNPLVVRFNGGHQAGHTVVTPQGRHVFSSLGSGSFRGAPTYWSSYCTFYPPGYLNEYKALADKGIHALFYLDSHSPVTTFYDVIYNRSLEQSRSPHGSCGVGFGATIERNENGCSLYAGDLWQWKALEPKLELISRYYQEKLASSGNQLLSHIYNSYDLNKIRKSFLKDVRDCTGLCELVEEDSFFRQSQHKTRSMIFEGAQGVLLDMDDGFFPHVTRSNTTSRNAMDLIQKHSLPDPSLYYVSRCYQTRHGAGPMTNEQLKPELYHTEKETNVHNQWQGQFRKSVLDLDLLMYAIACDSRFSEHLNRNLVLTCLDHIAGKIPATYRGRLNMYTAEELAAIILPGARSLITSNADCADHMQHVSRIPKAERA